MFKPKSDAVKIGQDSFKIPCRNGTQFNEGSIVRFDITRNAGFVDLANSYLEMEILLENPQNTAAQSAAGPMLSLDRDIGASSLISQLTLRSQDGGRVLEELRNYNTFAKVHYNATKSEGNMNKRSLLEGCAKTYMPQDNMFYTKNQAINPVAASTAVNGITVATNNFYKPVRRKVCVPLLGGIFSNPRSYPAMMLPTEVEIILENATRALRICNRGEGANQVNCDDQVGAIGAGVGRNQLFITQRSQFNTMGNGVAATLVPSSAVALANGEEQLNPLYNCWYRPGQIVRVQGLGRVALNGDYVAGVGMNRTIQSVKVMDENAGATAGKICLTFVEQITDGNAAGSTQITIDITSNTGGELGQAAGAGPTQGQYGYTIFNPRLVVSKVIPPPVVVQQITNAISKGQYNQDIISYVNVDNAIPGAQTTSTNILAADLSRVKAIISVPTSQTLTDNVTTSNALQGQYLNATQYQFQIDNKLAPDRRVQLGLEAQPIVQSITNDATLSPYRIGSYVNGFHRYEVEKALRSSNINVTNTHFLTNNPSQTTTSVAAGLAGNFVAQEPGSWLLGRSLGAGVGTSQNLVGKSCMLYLDYNANSAMVKLLKNFLIHIRTISIGMDGVSVFY